MITELQIDDYSRQLNIWPVNKYLGSIEVIQRGTVLGKSDRPLMQPRIAWPNYSVDLIYTRAFLSALAVALSTAEEWDKLTGQPITVLAELVEKQQPIPATGTVSM